MKRTIGLFLLLLFVSGSVILAQDVTGSIVGTVADPTGSPVPGAKVTVTNTDRNAVIRIAITDNSGNYSAPLLPIGHYSVTVEIKGFKRSAKTGIPLNVNDNLTINMQLEIGEVVEQVNVEANAVQVDLQTSAVGSLISGKQVTELSLNARNYEQLVSLMPGVVFTGTTDQIYVGVSNPLNASSNQVSFAVNGGRTSQNGWTVDGADNVDRGANLTLLNYPSVDAIAEFRVLRGTYSAEFGRDAGGMINVITKSGTNSFHGDAYEFFRNDKLAANTFFNNVNGTPRAPLRYNNFGYTLGGPVWIPKVYNGKNKTFFFFSEEFRRVINYTNITGTLPTAAEKQGIFPTPVCTSYTGSTCNTTATQITAIDPLAASYIKDIFSKIPDAPANHAVIESLRNIYNARQELIKVDHVFNSKWTASARYLQDSIPTQEPRGAFSTSGSLPGVSTTSTNAPGKGLVTRVTGSLSPTLVNEAGYNYSYGAVLSDPIGLEALVNSPDIQAKLPYPVTLGRVPTLSFSTLSGVVGYGPYRDYNRNHTWFDNLTKITGKHTVKAGVTISKYNKQENAATNNVGTFSYTTSTSLIPSGSGTSLLDQSWANFLLGHVTTFTQTARDITPDLHVNQAEMFVQDDYRVRPNLTLNLGVRYSLFRQPTDGNQFLNNFDPAFYDPTKAPQIDANGNLVPGTGDPLNGLIIAGKNSPYGNKISNENNHNFAPRVGLAWDPFGTGKTSIRAGYGIVFDSIQVSNVYESMITTNPSSVQSITISNTTTQNVAGGALVNSVAPPALAGAPLPNSTPYTQQWSLFVQRELPKKVMLEVGYSGSKGTHLIGEPDINEIPVGFGAAVGLTTPGVAFNRTTDPKLNAVRPYRGYNAINNIESWFISNYHSLQTQVRKDWGATGFLAFNYTWGKTLTNAGTDVATPMNTYNRAADYGLSPYDRKQVFNANWSYNIPLFKASKGVVKYALAGWQISGIWSISSGLPFNASDSTVGTDPGGLGILGSSGATARADQICDPNANAPHTYLKWFNTECFADVPAGQIRPGNAGRNTIRGPGYQKWDLSMFKNFYFNESRSRYLQFRAESFNTLNHTNFSSISATLNATSGATAPSPYGTVTAARDPRIVQLAAKLYF